MPLVEEFFQAPAAELQKVGNVVHAPHGRAPLEIVERPVLVVAGLYLQGRRYDAANPAVELLRPSLDQTPQPGREVRGPQESTRYISRVRCAREQPVRQYRLPGIRRDIQLLAPAVPVFLVVEEVRKLVAVRPALAERLAGEGERPQMLRIVVVVERKALRGDFARRSPLPEHRNLRASGVPTNAREHARRAFPQIGGGIDAERLKPGRPVCPHTAIVLDDSVDNAGIEEAHERCHRLSKLTQVLVARRRPCRPVRSRLPGSPHWRSLLHWRRFGRIGLAAARIPKVAIEDNRALQRRRALVDVAVYPNPVLLRPLWVQAVHQAGKSIRIVVGVQIALKTLNPVAAADRIAYRTGLVAFIRAKPSPKTTLVRFLHATRPYRQLRRGNIGKCGRHVPMSASSSGSKV